MAAGAPQAASSDEELPALASLLLPPPAPPPPPGEAGRGLSLCPRPQRLSVPVVVLSSDSEEEGEEALGEEELGEEEEEEEVVLVEEEEEELEEEEEALGEEEEELGEEEEALGEEEEELGEEEVVLVEEEELGEEEVVLVEEELEEEELAEEEEQEEEEEELVEEEEEEKELVEAEEELREKKELLEEELLEEEVELLEEEVDLAEEEEEELVEEENLAEEAEQEALEVEEEDYDVVVVGNMAVVDDVVVVEEEEDEDEDVVEVVPLSERIQRRVEGRREVAFEVPHPGSGDAAWRTGPCARGDPVALGSRGPWEALAFGAGSGGSRHGTADAERPSWSLLPASRQDSAEQPSRSLASGASPETSPPPKKSKYCQRDREAPCQAAWQRRKEREARRRQQEQEKERKRALATMLKAQRPGECQKYLTAALDPALFQSECGEQILSALQAASYSCLVENQAVPCSITWRRKIVSPRTEEEEDDEWEEDPNVLAVLPLEEFLSMVHSSVQEAQGCTEGQETLQSYVARAMEKMPGKTLALAIVGAQNYFRSFPFPSKTRLGQAAANGNQEEGQRKGRKRKAEDSGPVVTRMDVEEALLDLQLSKQIQVRFFETWGEFGEHATMFTKAVAEAPFKREREKTGLPFCFEKERCRGVKVARSQEGLLEAWKRQIQQFNRVSLEMAEAIVSVYPSPQLLYQAYSRCSSEQEKENLLVNIPVCRGDGVTATSRRIGPELSRRIYLQMTAPDPGLYLYFTG